MEVFISGLEFSGRPRLIGGGGGGVVNPETALSRCVECLSTMVSFGTFQRVTEQDETPMEIPQQEIARSVEEAAATPVVDDDVPMEEAPQPEVDHDGDAPMNEQDYDDTRTIAQPEMELDADDNEGNDPEDVNDQFFYLTQTCMWTRTLHMSN